MNVIGLVILVILLGVCPLMIGCIPAYYVDRRNGSMAFTWISGLFFMWAGFQLICVPLILLELIGKANFLTVKYVYSLYLLLLFGIGMFCYVKRVRIPKSRVQLMKEWTKQEKILVVIALALIMLQVILSVVLVYSDGDDAYYVAVSTLTKNSNTMYKLSPYSIGYQELDTRHSLAPFPIWIAYLSSVSGLNTALVAHSIVAPVLILCSYAIYYLIGRLLCGSSKERNAVFMIVIALFVLFGDYSSYTAENFMLARSRQGKAAVGNIVIPFLFYVLFVILRRIRDEKKVEKVWYVLLAATVTTACLCTALGSFLTCLLIAVVGVVSAIVFRRYDVLWKLALCCVPAAGFALLYLMM